MKHATNRLILQQCLISQSYSVSSSQFLPMSSIKMDDQQQLGSFQDFAINYPQQMILLQLQPQPVALSFKLILQLQTTSSPSNTFIQHWQRLKDSQHRNEFDKAIRLLDIFMLMKIQYVMRRYSIQSMRAGYHFILRSIKERAAVANSLFSKICAKQAIQKNIIQFTEHNIGLSLVKTIAYLLILACWVTLCLYFTVLAPQYEKSDSQQQIRDEDKIKPSFTAKQFLLYVIYPLLMFVFLLISMRVYNQVIILIDYYVYKKNKLELVRLQQQIKQKENKYNLEGMHQLMMERFFVYEYVFRPIS